MRHIQGIAVFLFMVLVLTLSAEAAEKENAAVKFFRGLFRFPAKTTEKSVGVATEATTKSVAIGTREIENVGEALTGSQEAAVGIVTHPIKETTVTGYKTTKGALMAPVEGAKESIK